MSYIAVDDLGTHIFVNKPIRVIRNGVNIWRDPEVNIWIHVPTKFPIILYKHNMLINCHIPLYKRNMNWGDNPILIK